MRRREGGGRREADADAAVTGDPPLIEAISARAPRHAASRLSPDKAADKLGEAVDAFITR
jgi:hypothetical protein